MNPQVRAALLATPVLAVALAGCSGSSTPTTSTGQPPPSKASSASTVAYQVTGTAHSVSFTYTNSSTDIAQEASDPVPYTKTVQIPKHTFAVLTLEVQNLGGSGDVTCAILVDGKLRKTSTSSGGYQVCIVTDTL